MNITVSKNQKKSIDLHTLWFWHVLRLSAEQYRLLSANSVITKVTKDRTTVSFGWDYVDDLLKENLRHV